MARAIESLDDSHSATAPPFVRGRFGVSRATACRQRWPHWPPQIVVISPAQSRPGGSIAPAPTATTCSRSCGPHVGRPHRAGAATPKTKPSGLPTPAAGFAINARSTPKPGVSTAHANKKSPTAHWRNHLRKMLILFKGAQPSTSPWCAWVNDPLEPDNSHPTGNHHPHHHTNSTTSHPSDALQSSAGRRTPSSAPSPGCSSSRCRAPDRETRTT